MTRGMEAPRIELIVMGGSAGALLALGSILPSLPADFPLPIALVLHVPPTKPSYLVEALRQECELRVKEAEDKEPLAPATLYVAPPNYHLLIEKRREFSLSADELVHFSRPAIDVLFESAADAYGPATLGLLLSGANEDGARGIARIQEQGGISVVQSPETASMATMPEAALRIAKPDHVAALPDIGPLLVQASRRPPHSLISPGEGA